VGFLEHFGLLFLMPPIGHVACNSDVDWIMKWMMLEINTTRQNGYPLLEEALLSRRISVLAALSE